MALLTRMTVLAFMVAGVMTSTGTAGAAPTFDVDGYSTCTATTAPAPGQDFDGFVTDCCVRHSGVPAPTRFGIGCVATMDASSPDERPTIVLPTRPSSPEDARGSLDDLAELPLPEPLP